jgi:hypothetical protein
MGKQRKIRPLRAFQWRAARHASPLVINRGESFQNNKPFALLLLPTLLYPLLTFFSSFLVISIFLNQTSEVLPNDS